MRQSLKYICLTICLLSVIARVEAQSHTDYPLDTIRGQIYYRYTVEKSVGLYRISVNFGVSQEDILRANPEVQKRGLRYGEILLVPAKDLSLKTLPLYESNKPVVIFAEEETTFLDDVVVLEGDASYTEGGLVTMDSTVLDSATIRLAVLLPFYTNAVMRDKDMDRFYDFYTGVLIAINELQSSGQPIEVYTYDIGKSSHRVTEVLEQPQMRSVDAIIGPVYNKQVVVATELAKRDSTLLLLPFASQVDGIEDNPYVLQFNPSEQTEADTLAHYLSQRGDSVHCVLIEAKEGEAMPSGIVALRKALAAYQVPTSTTSIRAILQDSLDGVLRPDVENIFVFNTERYGNLQALLPHLSLAAQSYPITIYSHYSWQKQHIPFPQIYTSVFSQSPNIPEFYDDTFRIYFGHELSSIQPRYDLLGYDLTRSLLRIVQALRSDNGADMSQIISEGVFWGVLSNIHYKRVSAVGGYENDNIHIIYK